MKLTLEQLRAWLDRKPPPREQDLEVVNRPPEEWAGDGPGASKVGPGTAIDEQFEAGHG